MDTVGLPLPSEVLSSSLLEGTWSPDARPSFGCSWILGCSPDLALRLVSTLYKRGAVGREVKDSNDILVPAVAG